MLNCVQYYGHWKKLTPNSFSDLNGEKIYNVAIEKQFIDTEKCYVSFLDAFLLCFSSYYNFGVRFPKDISTTLEMIQRYVLNDHPDSGTKSKKVSASKKKVISLIKKLKDTSL